MICFRKGTVSNFLASVYLLKVESIRENSGYKIDMHHKSQIGTNQETTTTMAIDFELHAANKGGRHPKTTAMNDSKISVLKSAG